MFRRFRNLFIVFSVSLLLQGCLSSFQTLSSSGSGASGDGAPRRPVNLSHVRNAVPQYAPKSKRGNHSPYKVFGKTYRVMDSARGYRQKGVASWYGTKFHGRTTSSGQVYDMYAMTAAHKHLPLPTYVKVTNLENKKQVIVKVNDRGPFHGNRIIDLSYAAATKLGFDKKGTAKVLVEAIVIDQPQSKPLQVESNLSKDSNNNVTQNQNAKSKNSHSRLTETHQEARLESLDSIVNSQPVAVSTHGLGELVAIQPDQLESSSTGTGNTVHKTLDIHNTLESAALVDEESLNASSSLKSQEKPPQSHVTQKIQETNDAERSKNQKKTQAAPQADKVLATTKTQAQNYLQVSAFSNLAAAKKMQQELRQLLVDLPVAVRVKTVEKPGQAPIHRVQVGPIDQSDQQKAVTHVMSENQIGPPILVRD